MDSRDTVTLWIQQLKSGDAAAAQKLWEAYFQRMVDLARRKLEGAKRAAADEEDIALSAFKSFCLAARNGKFPQLTDRGALWPLLMAITVNKSVDLIRHENRRKRGGREEAAEPAGRGPVATTLSDLLSKEPAPEFAAELAEQLDQLLVRLDATGDSDLRQIAIRKLEGYATPQIAEELGCVRRTVERKLLIIERLWGKDVPH